MRAKYLGWCDACLARIAPGDEISHSKKYGWIHASHNVKKKEEKKAAPVQLELFK